MKAWSHILERSQIVLCTDNEGVKDAFISGQTASIKATPILAAIIQLEVSLCWNTWFSKVPTEPNVADDPSRGAIQQLLDEGIPQCKVLLDDEWSQVLALTTKGALNSILRRQLQNIVCDGSLHRAERNTIRKESDLSEEKLK